MSWLLQQGSNMGSNDPACGTAGKGTAEGGSAEDAGRCSAAGSDSPGGTADGRPGAGASAEIRSVVPALLGACCFASLAAMRACDTLLPSLAAEFSVTVGQAARVIFAFAVAYGLLQLFFGSLGDRYGKLRIISFAALSCVVGNLMAAASPTLDWLVAARIVSGACAAGIFPLTMAWIGDNVPYRDRQAALARIVSAGVMGMLAGQWLSGFIGEWVGWRTVFLLLALLFLVTGGRLLRALKGEPPPVRPAQKTWQALRAIVATPECRRILAIVTVEGALAFGAIAFIPSWLQSTHGISLSIAGGIAAFYGIGGFLYTRVAQRLLRRLGESGLARLGGALLLAGLVSFAYVPLVAWTPVACLVTGFGFYCLHNTLQTNATQMAPAARGSAVSLFACLLFVGQSLGVSAAAWIADHSAPSLIFACAGVGLFFLSFLVGRRGSPSGAE